MRDARATEDVLDANAGLVGAALNGGNVRISGLHSPHYVHACTVYASTNALPTTRPFVLVARMAVAADQAREFIRRALEVSGLTPYALAKKAGVSSTTITRPLNDPAFKFVPKMATLSKIAEATGLTLPNLSDPGLTVESISRWIPLVGEVRAGTWTEIQDTPWTEERVPVHLPEFERASLFAVRVAGRSMDLKYVEGTIVIAVHPSEAGVRVGDDVIVRRHRGGLAETTLKEVSQEADGTYVLVPRSSDATFKAVRLTHHEDCQDGPEIIGVVIYSINPRRSGRGPLVSIGR